MRSRARNNQRSQQPTHQWGARPSRRRYRIILGLAWLCTAGMIGWIFAEVVGTRDSGVDGPATQADASDSVDRGTRSFHELLNLPDAELEQVDIIELNLAIARQIPELRDLDVAAYQRAVDRWADRVKRETDRYWYQFEKAPADYKNSPAYFRTLTMCTVIGQDFKVGYDLEGFSFKEPEDLFVHGVIDGRTGTCVSLPILHIAIGQRLGYPIRAVAVPGHTFCRWDDRETGERLNIEAANLGGLTDHDDEYYRHWPFEVDPRWEREHHVLTSLTMRQHAAVMVGCLGAYFVAKADYPAAIRWDALAHWLDPANRSTFVSLRLGVEHSLPRYFDADELAGRKDYWRLTPHTSIQANLAYSRNRADNVDE